MSIYEKLSNVQQKLKAPKNQMNKFGGYKYRSCEDILQAVKPLLASEGLTMTITDELTMIGDRYYIKATVTVIDTEEGDTHEVYGYAREEENKKGMDSMQLTGATSSYARKYALNGMFAIDDTKDSDATNQHGKDKEKPKKKSTNHINAIKKTYENNKEKLAPVIKKFLNDNKCDKISDLSKKQSSDLLEKLNEEVS